MGLLSVIKQRVPWVGTNTTIYSNFSNRFNVVDLLTMAPQHPNAVLDSEQEGPMLEGALTFLVILTSLRIHIGKNNDEIMTVLHLGILYAVLEKSFEKKIQMSGIPQFTVYTFL